jgi:EmrB/QacA subfamily drug resistance transporter
VVVGLDTTVLNVALPTISSDLGADTSRLQWLVDAYLLAVVAVMLPGGLLGDRFGRKRVLLGGLAVFLVGSTWSALSGNSLELMAARAVQGLGAAVIVPLALALAVTTFPPADRARAIGIITAVVAAGLPLGPIVAGALLSHFGWSSVFWINIPLVAVAATGCALFVPESTSPHSVHLDALGVVLSTAGLIALVYGVVRAPDVGWSAPQTPILLSAALLLALAFLMWQHRARHPLVDPGLFRQARFAWGCLAVIGSSGVLLGVLFVLPQYLQGVRGDGAFGVGLRTMPMMLGLLVAGSASSRLQQRWGPRIVISGAFGILCGGLLVCATAGPNTSYAVLGGGLAVVGAGIGAVVAPAMDMATDSAGEAHVGSASAVINTVRQLGGAIAVAALGSLLSAVYTEGVKPAVTDLPAPLQETAMGSIAGANAAADVTGSTGLAVRNAAAGAFSTSMMWVLISCALAAAVCGILIALFLRERTARRAAVAEELVLPMQCEDTGFTEERCQGHSVSSVEAFEQSAVRPVPGGGKPVAQVDRELDINESTTDDWCAKRRPVDDVDGGNLSEDDRAELIRLRRENTELQIQRDMLTRAVTRWGDEALGKLR